MLRPIGVAFVLLIAAPALSGEPALERALQSEIEAFHAENPLAPGVSVCVVCPALDLDWTGAVGTVGRDDPTPLTPAHTFRIASNTKTYVAAAVLRLVEQGRLALDAPLSGLVDPVYDALLRGDGYDTDAMTLAMVLSHTAGLGDHTDDPRFEERVVADPAYHWTVDEDLRLLVEWREPVGAPGERYRYSDTGYILLGTILERVTGEPLAAAVRGLVDYERLGLAATYWELLEAAPEGLTPRAHQYLGDLDTTGFLPYFDLYGGGGLVTDVRDLTGFLRRLMHGEVFEQASTLEIMIEGGSPDYRFGLFPNPCGDRELLGHSGFWNTFVFHDRDRDLTVGGCILNHDAARGAELACRLVALLAAVD